MCLNVCTQVRDASDEALYYSGANSPSLTRLNMTVFRSLDEGASWDVFRAVDAGSVAYSSLQVLPGGGLGLLYERSNTPTLVFEPDEIRH